MAVCERRNEAGCVDYQSRGGLGEGGLDGWEIGDVAGQVVYFVVVYGRVLGF